MAKKALQRKFKFEFEVTVEVEEVSLEHLNQDNSKDRLLHLQRLQQVMLENQSALREQMLAKGLSALQEYIDHLSTQDNLASLQDLLEELEPEERGFFEDQPENFSRVTRPLRTSCLQAKLTSGKVEEQSNSGEEMDWTPVWKDLQFEDGMSKLLRQFDVLTWQLPHSTPASQGHHFLPRHLTQQPDGAHMEACCSCGKVFEAVNRGTGQALLGVWAQYQKHYQSCNAFTHMRDIWLDQRIKGSFTS